MSETNFTERDEEQIRDAMARTHSLQKAAAMARAIAEIDSLRLENEGLKNSLFVAKMQTRTRSDEAWHRKTESLQAENDSLRAQLGEAQKQERELLAEVSDGQSRLQELRLVADGIRDQRDLAVAKCNARRSENERLRNALHDALAAAMQIDCTDDERPHVQSPVEVDCVGCAISRIVRTALGAPDCEVGAALAGETKADREEPDLLVTPRPLDQWDGEGFALFHRMPIEEPPYCGSPDSSDWPFGDGENVWWTPLPDCNEIMNRWMASMAKAQSETGGAA